MNRAVERAILYFPRARTTRGAVVLSTDGRVSTTLSAGNKCVEGVWHAEDRPIPPHTGLWMWSGTPSTWYPSGIICNPAHVAYKLPRGELRRLDSGALNALSNGSALRT